MAINRNGWLRNVEVIVNRRKIILIVGPSGVGKTSACQSIQERFPNCVARHLDGLASDWAVGLGWLAEARVGQLRSHINDDQLFLAFGLESIGMFASRHPGTHLVIDVGAGFQDARSAEHLHRIHDVVSITADPMVVYRRICNRPGEQRSFENYIAREFSERRVKVYSQTRHSINTNSLTCKETADRLAYILQKLISANA
jgi:shikimate kinase